MALIEVNTTWSAVGNGGGGKTITGEGTAFNTATHTIGPFYQSYTAAVLDPLPPDVHRQVGDILHVECAPDYTATLWVYAGGSTTTVATEANNVNYCGYTPPVVGPTCNLGVATVQQTGTADGATLTVLLSGTANGNLRYCLNGGPEQADATFRRVAPGTYTVQVRDTGLADCHRKVKVIVLSGPPVTVPAGEPAGVDFVEQPLWYPVAGVPANAQVLLELYAESAHGAEDFALVLPLRKWADAAGQVAFRLDTLLAPLLRAYALPPATGLPVTERCRAQLVNYFVRTSVFAPGQPGAYATSALRTALRGSLPAEWRGLDYWQQYRLERWGSPPFLSWQPTGAGSPMGLAKRITVQQPEWLFWLCPSGTPTQLRIRRRYTTSSGVVTQDEAVTLTGSRGAAGQLLAIPARPGAVAGAQQLTVTVESAQGEPLSALARFELVAATAQTRYLVFTNSLGCLDVLRCTGQLQATLEAKAEPVERPARFGDASGQATRQVYGLDASRKLQLATGWLTAAKLDWLQELAFAREAWLLHERLGLLPLDLTKRSFAHFSDEEPLRGLVLECDYAYDPTAYANPI